MEWHQKSMSQVDLLSYTVGFFSDLIPKDLAKCWSKQLSRLVSLHEKESITALTQSEMNLMRKKFSECELNVEEYHVESVELQNQDLAMCFTSNVSTACLNSKNRILKSPHTNVVIDQLQHRNLQSCSALLDSGSDISLMWEWQMIIVLTYNLW